MLKSILFILIYKAKLLQNVPAFYPVFHSHSIVAGGFPVMS